MQLAHYRTSISRNKLIKYRHEPDITNWQALEVRETPEQYFQPAIEVLDAIHRNKRAVC